MSYYFTLAGVATQILADGGVTLNGNKVLDGSTASSFSADSLLDNRLAILKIGKTGNLVVVIDSEEDVPE